MDEQELKRRTKEFGLRVVKNRMVNECRLSLLGCECIERTAQYCERQGASRRLFAAERNHRRRWLAPKPLSPIDLRPIRESSVYPHLSRSERRPCKKPTS
jgi:hypothetical protein